MAFLTAGSLFQHTAARRRLATKTGNDGSAAKVSTHSRPKAAGKNNGVSHCGEPVSTHSRPKAAGDAGWYHVLQFSVSTHSRPKAAGCLQPDAYSYWPCFNTQPPEGGWGERIISGRRLNSFNTQPPEGGWRAVWVRTWRTQSFNTQPPEGGWVNA